MLCVKRRCSFSLPFLGQQAGVPLIVMCNRGEQCERERMEVELLRDVVDKIGPFVVRVDAAEGVVYRGCQRACGPE